MLACTLVKMIKDLRPVQNLLAALVHTEAQVVIKPNSRLLQLISLNILNQERECCPKQVSPGSPSLTGKDVCCLCRETVYSV